MFAARFAPPAVAVDALQRSSAAPALTWLFFRPTAKMPHPDAGRRQTAI